MRAAEPQPRPDKPKHVKRARREARIARRTRRMPLIRLALAVLGRTPLPVAAVLGDLAGSLVYRLSRRLRTRILGHLEIALGDETSVRERRRIARRCVGLTSRALASYARLYRMGTERALGQLEVEGAEHLDAALAAGKGCIVVGYHYGLFELSAAWIGTRRDGAAVGRPAGHLAAMEVLIRLREELGCPTIQRGNARDMLRVLRAKRPLVIVADHDVKRVNGVFVPFFGRLAHTPAGPAALSQRTDAPLVPAFTEWAGLTRHRLRFLPPMTPREDLSPDDALLELTHRYTRLGEQAILRRPDHWLWSHKRWETRPEQRPGLPVLANPERLVPPSAD